MELGKWATRNQPRATIVTAAPQFHKQALGQGQHWTTGRVKDYLPDVSVVTQQGVSTAQMSGRKNAFASIWPGRCAQFPDGVEVSWQTVADCLNADKPIRI